MLFCLLLVAGPIMLFASLYFLIEATFAFLLWLWHLLADMEWQTVSLVVWARVGSSLVLAGLLLYYLDFWDATGTSKVPWTENLG